MSVEYLTFTAHEDIIDNVLEERGYEVEWTPFSLEFRDDYRTFRTNKEINAKVVEELRERKIDLYKKL